MGTLSTGSARTRWQAAERRSAGRRCGEGHPRSKLICLGFAAGGASGLDMVAADVVVMRRKEVNLWVLFGAINLNESCWLLWDLKRPACVSGGRALDRKTPCKGRIFWGKASFNSWRWR